MRDCANVNVREVLPDLLHDRLQPARRGEIERHLAACAECRAELAILRRVLAGAVAPRIDVARVVAAIPPYQAVPAWRRARITPQLRVAAAILLLVGGWGGWTILKGGDGTPAGDAQVAQITQVAPLPSVPVEPMPAPPLEPPIVPVRAPAELAVDSFHDVSDSELRALLDEMVSLEAVTPAETEVVPPSPGRSGA